MTMRNMTELELRVVQQLTDGELDGLAELLATEAGAVHPLVQRSIRKLIVGDPETVDFRLVALPHPNSGRSGVRAQAAKDAEGIRIATTMARNGGFQQRRWKVALARTQADLNVGKTKVTEAWAAHKDFVAACIRQGHIQVDEDCHPA